MAEQIDYERLGITPEEVDADVAAAHRLSDRITATMERVGARNPGELAQIMEDQGVTEFSEVRHPATLTPGEDADEDEAVDPTVAALDSLALIEAWASELRETTPKWSGDKEVMDRIETATHALQLATHRVGRLPAKPKR